MPRLLHWIIRHERALFIAIVLIQLVPIWAFTYLPTTDGPAHLASADVMRRYNDPVLGVFRQYYFISSTPSPNLSGHLLLAGLMFILPPLAAEKVLLSLYLILLPVSLRFAAISIRRSAGWIGFLALPLSYSYLLGQGFYNFCLSLAGFFFLVGFWWRNREILAASAASRSQIVIRAAALLGLSLIVYSCHLFSLLMASAVIGLLAAVMWVVAMRSNRPATRPGLRRLLISGAALLPAILMALIFRPSTHVPTQAAGEWSIKEDFIALFQFSSLTSYRKEEAWLGGAFVTLILALAVFALIKKVRRGNWSVFDSILLMPLVLLAFYLKAHDPISVYFYIPQRVMFYLFLMLLLWLAGQVATRRIKAVTIVIAASLALCFTASHALKYREFAPQLHEFIAAGDQITPNSTFLPLIYAPQGRSAAGKPCSIDVAPFYMASGYIAVNRQAVDLRNYEARTDHFPLRFRPEINPYDHLAVGRGFDSIPPKIDIAGYESKTGASVDYVLIWGMNDEQRAEPGTAVLLKQLDGYEKLDLPTARWTQLWKKRQTRGSIRHEGT